MGQPAGVGGCLDLQKGSRVKSLESLCYLGPSIILELFSLGNKFTTAAFLFNKLTYKYPSYASTHRIRQSLLILAWLMTTTVFPVSAIFCRKMTEKVNLSVTTVQYQKKGKSWRWKDILTSFESRLMCKGGFCHANFSSLTNVFVSITVFPLEHLQGKWRFSYFEWHIGHITLALA